MKKLLFIIFILTICIFTSCVSASCLRPMSDTEMNGERCFMPSKKILALTQELQKERYFLRQKFLKEDIENNMMIARVEEQIRIINENNPGDEKGMQNVTIALKKIIDILKENMFTIVIYGDYETSEKIKNEIIAQTDLPEYFFQFIPNNNTPPRIETKYKILESNLRERTKLRIIEEFLDSPVGQ